MSTIAKIIGYFYILATVLAMCGVIDMYVCVGKRGACRPVVPAPVKGLTA